MGAATPPISTCVPFSVVGNGAVAVALFEARSEPVICTRLPGASAPPTSGLKTCWVLLRSSSGDALLVTLPASSTVTGAKPAAFATIEIAVCCEVRRGVHVAE